MTEPKSPDEETTAAESDADMNEPVAADDRHEDLSEAPEVSELEPQTDGVTPLDQIDETVRAEPPTPDEPPPAEPEAAPPPPAKPRGRLLGGLALLLALAAVGGVGYLYYLSLIHI